MFYCDLNNVFTSLYEAGLQPTNAQVRAKDGTLSQKIVFPGAVLSYREMEVPLNLLKNNPNIYNVLILAAL